MWHKKVPLTTAFLNPLQPLQHRSNPREAQGSQENKEQDNTVGVQNTKLLLEMPPIKLGQNPHTQPKQGDFLLKIRFKQIKDQEKLKIK
jgi:hypothetical protein